MNGFAMITKDELIKWATSQGWKLDRWGHLQKEFATGMHRLKLSRIAARHEVADAIRLGAPPQRLLQGPIITADGKLAGMTR